MTPIAKKLNTNQWSWRHYVRNTDQPQKLPIIEKTNKAHTQRSRAVHVDVLMSSLRRLPDTQPRITLHSLETSPVIACHYLFYNRHSLSLSRGYCANTHHIMYAFVNTMLVARDDLSSKNSHIIHNWRGVQPQLLLPHQRNWIHHQGKFSARIRILLCAILSSILLLTASTINVDRQSVVVAD